MKKIVSLLFISMLLLFSLVSCGEEQSSIGENGKTNIRVAVLNGTTGFGMAQLMEKSESGKTANNYTFSVEQDPTAVRDQLIKGDIDIAALPTNLASVVYNRTQGGVKVIAINTLGVLYVVENGTAINSINNLAGKTIYTPSQNPSFILKYILNKNNINATVDDVTYSQPDALRDALVTGKLGENAIAVLPEPMVTIATNKNASLRVALDLTEEWNKVESTPLVQGCVVVRNAFLEKNRNAIDAFLSEYKTSIEYLNSNMDDASKLIEKHKIFANAAIAKKAIPNCNIVYVSGADMKSSLSGFLKALKTIAPASIGVNLPVDDFYYVK